MKTKKAMKSCLWVALAPNFEDLRKTMMHILVYSDCSSVLQRNGGDMAQFSKETGDNFLLCLVWSFEFWGRGLVRKQPNCWLHLGFQIMLINPSFITCQHFSGQFWMASVKLSQHEIAPFNPNPLSFVCQWVGDPNCTSFSDTKMIVRYGHGHCCSNAKTFLNILISNPCFDHN